MNTAIIIPARYGSTRFPGKPLAKIGGQAMLSRVYYLAQRIAQSFENVNVAITSDDERIKNHALEIGADFFMTSPECPSGSDRVLSAAQQMDQRPDFVINLQGDAPFTPPQAIKSLIEILQSTPDIEVTTPVHKLSWDDLDRLRENKKTTPYSGTCAIVNSSGKALWFSKNIIPAIRKEGDLRKTQSYSPIYQHMGLYGFRYDILEKFCSLPQGIYEALEGLEQLRLLENDISIQSVEIKLDNGIMQSGIDTPNDLERAERLLKEGIIS